MNIKTIMTADPEGKELVVFAQDKAKILVREGLKRAQIRIIFSEMRQIEALWNRFTSYDTTEGKQARADALRRLNMLKPKMAYQSRRNAAVTGLAQILTEAITEVVNAPEEKRDEMFKRFTDLFEAILAYHRSEGGEN
ncbi:MAG TPA: type III-A CRISPR-associated protein Csm2 [Anaerolineaceae bacterium]